MKRIFLVDFENVHSGGLIGSKKLTSEDEIILFYSDNHDTIAFIREHLNEIQCAKIVKKRQNALDFQLSSYLGFLIHKAVCDQKLADTQFFIVSKDTGYDYVESFWEETPFVKNLKITPDITRVENIQKALTPPKPKTSAEQQKKIDAVMKEETTPQGFNNALVKEFGSEQAGEFYKANKAKFKEMHKQIT